jgi:hypothetical protein
MESEPGNIARPGRPSAPVEGNITMTTVRAKFKVQSVTESEGGLKSVNLSPVVGGSPENEKFFKWTPGGQIQLGTINPDAAAQFTPGRQFYVDFTAADVA